MEITEDPFDLNRFVHAQETVYTQVLAELQAGCKETHWMWFIFPQMKGLGFSSTSQKYGIGSLKEAQAYFAHPLLGSRLQECCQLLLQLHDKSAHDIFDDPDDLKLHSSLTLFGEATTPGSIFHQLIEKYFAGQRDRKTLQLLQIRTV